MENNESSSHYDHSQIKYLSSTQVSFLSMEKFGNSSIEIFRGKTLNINENLEELQKKSTGRNFTKTLFCLCMGIYQYDRN